MTEKNGDLKYKTDNAIDEAYRRGYEDKAKEIRDGEYTFYEKGLNDAWECAKKAWSMSETEFHKIFNTEWDFEDMLDNLSATEVVQKIKDYEERQKQTEKSCENCNSWDGLECVNPFVCHDAKLWTPKQTDDEIKVGDEVVGESGVKVVVTNEVNHRLLLLYPNGVTNWLDEEYVTKTGRHFPQIAEVLEQMRKESEYHADPYHADFAWDVKTVIDSFRKESE